MMKNIHQISYNKKRLKIGRIQYINVDPVYYGFDAKTLSPEIQIISRPPAVLNKMMADGALDISSVSSSAFARNSDQWLLLPNLSISCYGKVMSVLLVSHHPFEALDRKTVLLTDESSTAVDLLKLLFSANAIQPAFQTGSVKSPSDLSVSAGAGLVIGDAALKYNWQQHFTYVWDLCEMWNNMTGLPFVFGVWAVRKSVAKKNPEVISTVIELFNQSRHDGLQNLSRIIHLSALKLGIDPEICKTYYHSMNYSLKEPEFQSLKEFFSRLRAEKIIKHQPEISFFDDRFIQPAVGVF